MNQQVLMKKIKKIQEEMLATQQEIENTVFYAVLCKRNYQV